MPPKTATMSISMVGRDTYYQATTTTTTTTIMTVTALTTAQAKTIRLSIPGEQIPTTASNWCGKAQFLRDGNKERLLKFWTDFGTNNNNNKNRRNSRNNGTLAPPSLTEFPSSMTMTTMTTTTLWLEGLQPENQGEEGEEEEIGFRFPPRLVFVGLNGRLTTANNNCFTKRRITIGLPRRMPFIMPARRNPGYAAQNNGVSHKTNRKIKTTTTTTIQHHHHNNDADDNNNNNNVQTTRCNL